MSNHHHADKNSGKHDTPKQETPKETMEQSIDEVIQEVLQKKPEGTEAVADKEASAKKDEKNTSESGEIKKLKEEIEGLKDARLRLLAEFDNFKRRTARESGRLIESANEGLLKSILPVLENFERALHPDHKTGDCEALLKGVELVYTNFSDILKKAGLVEFNPVGEVFDPEKHEAIMHVESAEVPDSKIIQVFQKGYSLNNRMIQYAKVSVSKGNAQPESK